MNLSIRFTHSTVKLLVQLLLSEEWVTVTGQRIGCQDQKEASTAKFTQARQHRVGPTHDFPSEGTSGSLIVKMLPCPGVESTSIVPP